MPAPFVLGQSDDVKAKEATEFRPERHWGNVGPQYSVESSVYGLDTATARVPDDCSVTQAHIYVRSPSSLVDSPHIAFANISFTSYSTATAAATPLTERSPPASPTS